MISLYLITNLQNGMVYVGQTRRPVASRWLAHLSKARNGSTCYLHNAIRKYGGKTFKVTEMLRVGDAASASQYEKALIALYRSADPNLGYNLTDGGENGVPNEVVRRHISERMKGNKHASGHKYIARSPDHCRHISEALKGKIRNPFSPEHRRKIGEANHGRQLSDSEKSRISLMNKGRKHTEEARKRMGNSHRGSKRTAETRQRMSEARTRWWAIKREVPCLSHDELRLR